MENMTHAAVPELKNKLKGMSFAYAYSRINQAIKQEFYLEAITLSESILSDRLLSFVKSHDKKVGVNTTLKQLISKARTFSIESEVSPMDLEMFDEIDEWRDKRNKCVHSAAKSEPGVPTISVEEFVAMARESAVEGKRLSRKISDWNRGLKTAQQIKVSKSKENAKAD